MPSLTKPLDAPVAQTGRRPLDVAALHAAHAEFVWLTLQRFGVRPADLEDMLQEVFLVVHRRLDTYDDSVSKVTTWLYGICMRVASVYRRRAYVRREVADEDPGVRATAPEREQPDEVLAARQAEARLARLLDELELERRAVFVMFEIEGLPCTQIAAMTGAPLGTVYSRLQAARRDFAQALARDRAREGGRAVATAPRGGGR